LALGAALLCALLAQATGAAETAYVAYDRYPDAAAAYAVALDGRLLWSRALDTPHAPASLSKLLAALVILEKDWNPDAVVRVSSTAASADGARIGLREGERLTARDALTAMLVRSANDACLTLVERTHGTASAFAARMNLRAKALGMTQSNFVNPCGLDAVGQHTTVRDLLRLAAAAIQQPEIALRGRAQSAEIHTLGGRMLRFISSNALIGREPVVIGLKSGFTSRAGKCLIALAEHNGHRVWIVLLDSKDRWWTASGLLQLSLSVASGALSP
jgi:D-alanyl-D-alanine carboxypeptidase (penicillin-binding protein 5/6)